MTYLWQEEKKKPYYRFQTDEKAIADKMKRRNKFKLVGSGMNCPLWIFQTTFTRPVLAKNTLKVLTGKKPIFDNFEEILYA